MKNEIKAGDRVTVGKGSTIWTVLEVVPHGTALKIASGKRVTMTYAERCTVVAS